MRFVWISLMVGFCATNAQAHANDQAFVLLLPTGIYTIAGLAAVFATIVLMALLPPNWGQGARPLKLGLALSGRMRFGMSHLSFAALMVCFYAGLNGSRDPLANPLPLMFWTVFWVGFVAVQGILGDAWRFVSPWRGLLIWLRRSLGLRPFLRLPDPAQTLIGTLTYLGFAAFLLADPAPSDPSRLAWFGISYFTITLVGALFFGQSWLVRCEGLGLLLRWFAKLSAGQIQGRWVLLSWPGWQINTLAPLPLAAAIFPLILLGAGSFDGLNETFFWLDLIGVNPLMFPGRSAVILPSLLGLVGTIGAVLLIFILCVMMGQLLIGQRARASHIAALAPSVLPIALGYHIAHFFPSFLVEIQYVWALINTLIGAPPVVVTTGFLFDPARVHILWLCQAGAVVLGHVLAIILSHSAALRLYDNTKNAVISQIPMGVFMIAYTFFGLWLLATPRGA